MSFLTEISTRAKRARLRKKFTHIVASKQATVRLVILYWEPSSLAQPHFLCKPIFLRTMIRSSAQLESDDVHIRCVRLFSNAVFVSEEK